jgi:hypothetical protein
METDLKQQVLNTLSKQQVPLTAMAISREIPGSTKPSVNSTLYGLLRTGHVEQASASPPTWKLGTPKQPTIDPNHLLTLIPLTGTTAKDLAAALSTDVKTVNAILYQLETQRVLTHSTSTPPLWVKSTERDTLIHKIALSVNSMSVEQLQALVTHLGI